MLTLCSGLSWLTWWETSEKRVLVYTVQLCPLCSEKCASKCTCTGTFPFLTEGTPKWNFTSKLPLMALECTREKQSKNWGKETLLLFLCTICTYSTLYTKSYMYKINSITHVCEVGTVGKISDCQPGGPGFNPGTGWWLNFGRPSFTTLFVDRDVKPLV